MVKAVFTTKVDSAYNDEPGARYHFPETYEKQVRAALDDLIIFYEPRRPNRDLSSRGGRQAYFAVARVKSVERDPRKSDHLYANLAEYLEFDKPVPFRDGEFYYESGLQRADGQTSKGAFGRSVRAIPDPEFEVILAAGFIAEVRQAERRASVASPYPAGMAEEQARFEVETTVRPMVESISSRLFRDEAFRRQVRLAYGNTCALSGLKLINGGGRPEVQAAHIRPVASNGTDSVRNGLALSGTLHWMFDRGLVSVADDYSILKSKSLPNDVRRLLVPEGMARVPADDTLKPHHLFLRFHRENVFKG
jgi:putative restriction endonuclease